MNIRVGRVVGSGGELVAVTDRLLGLFMKLGVIEVVIDCIPDDERLRVGVTV